MSSTRTYPAARAHSRRRSAPDLIIAAGLLLTVLVLMFRPASAEALLPSSVWVFPQSQSTGDTKKVPLNSLPQVTREYDVLMKGDEEPTRLSFTGVPLVEFLKSRGDVDPAKVPFLKIRFDDENSDKNIRLLPMTGVSDEGPPPMILDNGVKPGIGKWSTPSIVPGQPGARPISEREIQPFNRLEPVAILPAPENARIMSVSISKKKKSSGEWLLTANVSNSPGGRLTYRWFGSGSAGDASTKKRFATTDATNGKEKRSVSVVVTAEDGSTGADDFNYTSRKADDGATRDPGYGKSTNPGGNTPTPTPAPTPSPFPTPTPTPSPTPSPSPSPAQPTTPPTQTPDPTPPPSTEDTQPQAVDTSGVSDLAKNVNSTQPLTTVSGVLLAAPTATATSPGGGTVGPSAGLTPLQQAVASAAESIFQPVEDAGDLWPYMVALLFALGLSGAVREWINP